jgi:hypothetical protein
VSPSSGAGAFSHIFFSFIATGDSSDEATVTTDMTDVKHTFSLQQHIRQTNKKLPTATDTILNETGHCTKRYGIRETTGHCKRYDIRETTRHCKRCDIRETTRHCTKRYDMHETTGHCTKRYDIRETTGHCKRYYIR